MSGATTLRSWFGISPAAGRVLDALYEAGGETITRNDLEDFAGGGSVGVAEAIHAIKATMAPPLIETLPGSHVRITPSGLLECRQALAEAYKSGRAA